MKKNKKDISTLILLFFTFLKIGAFTFGGGYAMIPIISREIAEKRKWLSDDDILEIIAISESTPGPIAINAATFVGYKIFGFWGSFCSTLAVVLPSFIIISVISVILKEFESLKIVNYAFFGIRAGVLALVLKAFWLMYKKCDKNSLTFVIAIIGFTLSAFFGINVLFIIILSAMIGLAYYYINNRRDNI